MRFFRLLALSCLALTLSGQNLFNSITIQALQMTGDSNPVFLAGTTGGLFVSRDEMGSWNPIALEPNLARPQPGITQIERDPFNSGAFYAAGGRLTSSFISQALNQSPAIFRTDNLGETWTAKTSGIPADGDLRELYVSLTAQGTLYALVEVADEPRVYKSTNRGDGWSLLRTLPSAANRVIIHKRNPNLWYYASGRAIFKSTNEGATWASAGPFPIRAASGPGLQNTLVAFATIPDNESILLVSTGGPVFGGDEFNNGTFFSDNQGASWQRKTTGTAQQIHVDGVVLAHQVEGRSLWISNDSGRTFREPVKLREGAGRADGFLVDRRNSSTIHSGLYRSMNGGQSWTRFEAGVTPFIGADEALIESAGSTNDQAPRVQSIRVEARGTTQWRLPFTIESSQPWLTVSPGEGNTAASVTVRTAAGGLPVGVQEASLTIRSAAAANAEVVIPVRLTVTQEPAADPSPTILTFAGDGTFGSSGDGGPAAEASLESPTFMTFNDAGGLYISDQLGDRVRYVNPAGVISTFAGTGVGEFSGDGGPATQAGIDSPRGLSVGRMGEVYICDGFNRRVRVVTANGTISTFAGNGEFGSVPATGRVEDLRLSPNDIIATPDGGAYLTGSGTFRINPDGTYTRWSSTSYSALALSPEGRLYGVTSNRVFELRPNNFSQAYAGLGESGYSGDGGPALAARLNSPSGIAFDKDGRLFIADTNNHVVRMVDRDRTISTYAGNGVAGDAGDGSPANQAQLNRPAGVEVGPDGRLYISGGRKVRMVLPRGSAGPAPVLSSAGVVSAASFTGSVIAPSQIVSIFGSNLSAEVGIATQTPLPETLAGTRAELVDASGATRRLSFFFVSPGQINAFVSEDVAAGQALLRVIGPDGQAGEASIQVASVAPGLFSANARGEGVAAAAAVRVAADGTQTPVNVLSPANPLEAAPIDVSSEDPVVLLLYGTGFRNFSGSVNVSIGGVAAQVVGVAPQPDFVGLDQMNVIIPRELAGRGEAEVRVEVDGEAANTVTIAVQ